ncbi:MAG TPA: hypothetical protein VMB50_12065 [Myxococcales bacterium]|nr:hypothetical protein [Myxococcales bacterium]
MRLRPRLLRLGTVGAALSLGAAAAALHGCNSTAGGLIPSLPVEIGGPARDAGGPLVFGTRYFRPSSCGYSYDGYACGWQVELDQAVIGVGPLYFYTAPPSVQNAQTGSVIIQVLGQQFVDVVDPTLYPVQGGANGESGPSPSVDVFLLPPGCSFGQPSNTNGGITCQGASSAPVAAYQDLFTIPSSNPTDPDAGPAAFEQLQLQTLASGSSAFVAGTATEMLADMIDGGLVGGTELDGGLVDAGLVVVPFYGFITIDSSVGSGGADQAANTVLSLEQVAGASPCPDGGDSPGCVCTSVSGGDAGEDGGGIQCGLDFTTQPSVLQIRVDPSHWFDGVDFSLLRQEQYTGKAWLPDSGSPLTWNFLNGKPSADSSFNTALVQGGLQSATGVYFFSVVPQGANP